MKHLALGMLFTLLAGCAVGQRFDYTRATPVIAHAPSGSVAVSAQDRRPYVVSGKKGDQFVGLFRSGAGIPYGVVTRSGHPFSQDVTDVLARALGQKGASVAAFTLVPAAVRDDVIRAIAATGADRAIVLTINEWKTDTVELTTVYFDLRLEEFDQAGRVLRASESHGTDQISGYTDDVIAKGATDILQKRIEELFSGLKVSEPVAEHKTPTDRLQQLQLLLDQGLIKQDEYERKRLEILKGL